MAKISANKVKRKAPRSAWRPGQSGNPAGRPAEGESWAAILRWASNLTGEEATVLVPPEMGRHFYKLGKLKLKEAVALRVLAALMFDPNGRLLQVFMDRAEGSLAQTLNVYDWRREAKEQGIDAGELFNRMVAEVIRTRAGSADGGGDAGGPEPNRRREDKAVAGDSAGEAGPP